MRISRSLRTADNVSYSEPYVGLVVVAGALTGRLIGEIIALTGESLEESSDLKDHSILVVFPVAIPVPSSAPPPADPIPEDTRMTPAPPSSNGERSLLF